MTSNVAVSSDPLSAAPGEGHAGSLVLQTGKRLDGSLEPLFLQKLSHVFCLRHFVAFGAGERLLTEEGRALFETAHFVGRETRENADSLGTLFSGLDGAPLIYLGPDALAFTPGQTDPVVAVLESSKSAPAGAVFVLDDLGALTRSGPTRAQGDESPFPRINSLHSIAKTLRPSCQFLVYGALGLIVPEAQGLIVSPVIYALTVSVLFDGRNLPVQDLISAESLIGNASPEEKAALHALAANAADQGLFGQYAKLWEAIACIGENKLVEASRLYLELCQGAFPHWRAYWYLVATFRVLGEREHARNVLEKLVVCAPEFEPGLRLLEQLRAEEEEARAKPAASASQS